MGTVETATPFSPADLAKLEALRKSMAPDPRLTGTCGGCGPRSAEAGT